MSGFTGSNSFHGIPYGAFPAADGAVNIGVNRDDFWRRFCTAMGKPGLGTDPRYATYVDRVKRQREVHELTEAFTRQHTRAEIVAKLIEVDVPVASILGLKEVIRDNHLNSRGALWDVDDGIGGTFTLPANACWLERPEHKLRIPRLGESRDGILQNELGLSPDEIARLANSGAFGSGKPRVAAKKGTVEDPALL
ncbi:MAG: CoA transferase [Betaproteobacteria bacterium]|nr:CoA transferase [Betaproteobacteria bacterium]